jgi:hypothetical protein
MTDILKYSIAAAKVALQIHGLEMPNKRLLRWETFIKERQVKRKDLFQPI